MDPSAHEYYLLRKIRLKDCKRSDEKMTKDQTKENVNTSAICNKKLRARARLLVNCTCLTFRNFMYAHALIYFKALSNNHLIVFDIQQLIGI